MQWTFVLVAAVALAVLSVVMAHPHQPENPIIGIFTDPMSQCPSGPPVGVTANSCVEGYFVRWLESAGIRTVPFPWNASASYQRSLAKKVNGVLFPGGGIAGVQMEHYFERVQRLFDWAVEWAVEGDPFFLWGTCQGFQVLSAAAARSLNVIVGPYHGMYPSMMALNFTKHANGSKLWGPAPRTVMDSLEHHNTTLNWHHLIVKPSVFERPGVKELLVPLSTNNAPDGTEFVSSFEGRVANIFATQFHPERPPYSFSNDIESHSARTIGVSQYLADFVASRLKMNNHSFDTPLEAEAMMMEKWPSHYYGWGRVDYWINDPEASP